MEDIYICFIATWTGPRHSAVGKQKNNKMMAHVMAKGKTQEQILYKFYKFCRFYKSCNSASLTQTQMGKQPNNKTTK